MPKRLEPYRDKVGALEDRVAALEDRSPQETRLEPVPEIGWSPRGWCLKLARLEPWEVQVGAWHNTGWSLGD